MLKKLFRQVMCRHPERDYKQMRVLLNNGQLGTLTLKTCKSCGHTLRKTTPYRSF